MLGGQIPEICFAYLFLLVKHDVLYLLNLVWERKYWFPIYQRFFGAAEKYGLEDSSKLVQGVLERVIVRVLFG